MDKLTPEQIARYAYEAGFRGHGLITAVAVALAESAGRPHAHNTTPPDNSYGLWQINMYGGLGPDRRDEYDLESNKELFDPATNAEVANAISDDGRDFTPWTTYTSGKYRQFLDEARKAAKAVSRGNQGSGGSNGSGGSGDSGTGGVPAGGFAVDTTLLTDYVRRTRAVADGLTSVNTRQVHRVRSIADDSFGKIGRETGFAAALDDFGVALRRQVKGVGANADKLAASTAKTTRAYNRQDEEIAGNFNQQL